MNTRDTELIYEAYNKRVVSIAVTEEEAAQIFERSIEILFEYQNYLIQEGFISMGKKMMKNYVANQARKSFPIVNAAAGKAFKTLANIRKKNTGSYKELIADMVAFVKAAAQNSPDTNSQLINVVVAALKSLPQEKVREIVAQFRESLVPSVSEIHSAAALPSQTAMDSLNQQTMGRLATERFEGHTRRNFNTRYNLIEDVEFVIITGINREIIRENKAILNAALDIVEENIADTTKSDIQSAKPSAQSTGNKALNIIQTALDVVGVEPTWGTAADVGNGLISLLRAAATKEPDQRKKHLLNAAISAVSIIPGADVVKLLKARKLTKPLAKGALAGAKALRTYKQGKATAGKIKLATGNTSSNDLLPQPTANNAPTTTRI